MSLVDAGDPEDTEPEAVPLGLRFEMRSTLAVTFLLALLAGVVFPAAVIGLGQLFFPGNANGSLIRNTAGEVIGAEPIGQAFTGDQYFHPRPSAAGTDGYDASASSGLNLGPTNPALLETVEERAAVYRQENGLDSDAELPADAVTTSASGLDPHISPANAYLQAARVAAARGISEDELRAIIDDHVDRPLLGFFGEPRVNVLLLNLALDRGQQ
nr:K30 [uncultured bacterium]